MAMIEVITGILALLAGGFALVAAVGVVRFPDALTRMHASSKVGAFAGSLALICAAVDIGSVSAVTRAVIAILFLFLTAPIGAHLLGRAAAWRSGQDARR
ncbi:sodium:proton antiporter [Haematobacter genomosp. 1]|uniref:Sodium:proton antiporter n=2 Tax=Paracoccaceae TaxID=31989 RepID=A0A212A9J1_9RHOB|nr:sodium:proton antiporter [Haematobacter genomosp. 1]